MRGHLAGLGLGRTLSRCCGDAAVRSRLGGRSEASAWGWGSGWGSVWTELRMDACPSGGVDGSGQIVSIESQEAVAPDVVIQDAGRVATEDDQGSEHRFDCCQTGRRVLADLRGPGVGGSPWW